MENASLFASAETLTRQGGHFDRVSCINPRAGASDNVEQVYEPLLLQNACRSAGAVTTGTNDRRAFLRIQSKGGNLVLEFCQGSRNCRWHMSALILKRAAHIDHLHSSFPANEIIQFVHANLWHDLDCESSREPTGNAISEITLYAFDADPRQSHNRLVNLLLRLGYDH